MVFVLLQLDEINNVVHRDPVLRVTFTNGTVLTIKEDPQQKNGQTLFDLKNIFLSAKYVLGKLLFSSS
jgi:hypothetical protein